jgi:hypothetical protein
MFSPLRLDAFAGNPNVFSGVEEAPCEEGLDTETGMPVTEASSTGAIVDPAHNVLFCAA